MFLTMWLMTSNRRSSTTKTNKKPALRGTTKIEWGEQTDIWGPIREKTQSSGISTQQKSIIQDVLEEIAAGTKDSVKRVGFYFIDSPDGTDCDAEITDQHPTVSWASLLTTTKILVNSQSSSSPQL